MAQVAISDYPFPVPPEKISLEEKQSLIEKCRTKLKDNNAVLIAHYYTDPDLQELAEATGGFVGDSLEMAKFGAQHPADCRSSFYG